jgi:pullulanase/glycogen debranching enzyme
LKKYYNYDMVAISHLDWMKYKTENQKREFITDLINLRDKKIIGF